MKKKRITAYVNEDFVEWLDTLVDQGTFRSRSHGVEECIRKLKIQMAGLTLGK